MSKPHPIKNCENHQRLIDVVFVHGADGDWKNTWCHDKRDDMFWPSWLGEEFPQAGIWSVDYEAKTLAWKGTAMPLINRAINVLDGLSLDGLGQRPLLFVCHSLGGLLVKQMLLTATSTNSPSMYKHMAEQTKGVVFLSTPHSGVEIATSIDALNKILLGFLRPNAPVNELKAHDSNLRELNRNFRGYVIEKRTEIWVYYEARPTNNIMVVNGSTADPGIHGVTPVSADDDHISICKLKNRDAAIYKRVTDLIKRNSPMGKGGPMTNFAVPDKGEERTRVGVVPLAPDASDSEILDALDKHFSEGELEKLSFQLEVDWRQLRGEVFSTKAIALIQQCKRQGKSEELLRQINQTRNPR